MSSSVDLNRELIARCRERDPAAQKALYERYAHAMFNTAFRILRNREDARDALQDAFVKAFNNIEQHRPEAAFGGWLKRIVINTSINAVKRRGPIWVEDGETVVEKAPVEEKTESYAELRGVDVDMARTALLELPDGYRAVLSLYLLEGYDHTEISEILGISVNTSLSQFSRGKQKLRELLTNKYRHGRA